jgi:DNA polymerase-3 subunit delta'
MAIARIIGHAHARQLLLRALAGPRRAHAYLFDGPRGVGKMSLATEFARALLCEAGGPDACDRCPACDKLTRGLHPYYFHFSLPPGDRNISIETLRKEEQLGRKIALKPCGSPYKIAAFDDAEMLSADAANWLLKILEEPPPQTIFLLVTAVRRQLPSTILSRCQRIRCGRLSPAETKRVLVDRASMPEAEAEKLLPFADGSPGRALALRESGTLDLLGPVRDLFNDFARGAYGERLDALVKAFDLKKSDSAEARRRSRLLLSAVAEEVAAALRGAPSAPAVRAWAAKVGDERATEALERILSAQVDIDRNANPLIVLEAAFGDLAATALP